MVKATVSKTLQRVNHKIIGGSFHYLDSTYNGNSYAAVPITSPGHTTLKDSNYKCVFVLG